LWRASGLQFVVFSITKGGHFAAWEHPNYFQKKFAPASERCMYSGGGMFAMPCVFDLGKIADLSWRVMFNYPQLSTMGPEDIVCALLI
jgi:hypothetical protein